MYTSSAAFTVTAYVALCPLQVAVIVALPEATPLTVALFPFALTDATAAFEVVHVTAQVAHRGAIVAVSVTVSSCPIVPDDLSSVMDLQE